MCYVYQLLVEIPTWSSSFALLNKMAHCVYVYPYSTWSPLIIFLYSFISDQMICQRRLHGLARRCLCKTDKSPTKSGSSRRITQCLSTSLTVRKPTLFGSLNYPRWRELRRVMSTEPHVTVKPDGHLLMDDILELGISGLAKQQRVTLHASLREGGAIFESCCCFTANEYGEVDLATEPSLSGSYTGKQDLSTRSTCSGFLWLGPPCLNSSVSFVLTICESSAPFFVSS